MDKVRIRYSKAGKAKYISHLDLASTMQRVLLRAGAALKYSEGFNPHPYISVALPLAVGMESGCELMDIALEGGSISDKINHYMPDGLRMHRAYRAWRSFNEIKWIDFECFLHYDGEPPADAEMLIAKRFSMPSLVITKKTKRGESAFDVSPHIRDAAAAREGSSGVKLTAKISAQNPTVSHKDIINIISDDADIPQPDTIAMKRIEIYDANMVLFK